MSIVTYWADCCIRVCQKTKSGHIMTARPSGVLSRCTLPKNISLLTIGSKSSLPKAIWFYKGFCKKSLTKCQKFSYLPFLGWKYLKFQFWKSFLISTNQDGSFDTHIGIVTYIYVIIHISWYVIKWHKMAILWHILTYGILYMTYAIWQDGYQKNRLD